MIDASVIAVARFAVEQADLQGALLGPVGFVVAFVVGTVSFFSPCVLPLLPGYLSYVSGLTGEDAETGAGRRRVVLGIGLFVLGFATLFTAFGAAAGALGEALTRYLPVISRIGGVIIIVMGLAFLVPRFFPFLEREGRPFFARVKPGLAGAYPLGLAFAAGWTPCVGPGLAVMLNFGASGASPWRAALLLMFFSFGFGLWFLLAGLGLRRAFTKTGFLGRNMRTVQAIGGAFMVTIGILLVTDLWTTVMAPIIRWANHFAPAI